MISFNKKQINNFAWLQNTKLRHVDIQQDIQICLHTTKYIAMTKMFGYVI